MKSELARAGGDAENFGPGAGRRFVALPITWFTDYYSETFFCPIFFSQQERALQ